jgi:hypothetical protein
MSKKIKGLNLQKRISKDQKILINGVASAFKEVRFLVFFYPGSAE